MRNEVIWKNKTLRRETQRIRNKGKRHGLQADIWFFSWKKMVYKQTSQLKVIRTQIMWNTTMMKRPSYIQSKFSNFTVCLLNTPLHIIKSLASLVKNITILHFDNMGTVRDLSLNTAWRIFETYTWIHQEDCLRPLWYIENSNTKQQENI